MKVTSSNNKEIQFELEISKERLEQNKLDIEKTIKEVVEFEGLDAKEAAEYAASLRERGDLLFNVQKVISKMSDESIQRGDKISLEELESMITSQYSDRAFQTILQNYGRHSNAGKSKLSSIGPENVHIEKIEKTKLYSNYRDNFNSDIYKLWFKTQKGEKISLELNIDKSFYNPRMSINELASRTVDSEFLNIKQKLQIAIGQMPAESFKGLKRISVLHPMDGNLGGAGTVEPYQIAPVKKFDSIDKKTGEVKLKEKYWFYKTHPV